MDEKDSFPTGTELHVRHYWRNWDGFTCLLMGQAAMQDTAPHGGG